MLETKQKILESQAIEKLAKNTPDFEFIHLKKEILEEEAEILSLRFKYSYLSRGYHREYVEEDYWTVSRTLNSTQKKSILAFGTDWLL